MKPGRKLDALIAEKVMGWKRLTYAKRNVGNKKYENNEKITGFWHSDDLKERARAEDCNDYYNPPEDVWSPSTDIAAAWEVVEKLSQKFFMVETRTFHKQPHQSQCLILREAGVDEWIDVIGISIPHAVCLAALRATSNNPLWRLS